MSNVKAEQSTSVLFEECFSIFTGVTNQCNYELMYTNELDADYQDKFRYTCTLRVCMWISEAADVSKATEETSTTVQRRYTLRNTRHRGFFE